MDVMRSVLRSAFMTLKNAVNQVYTRQSSSHGNTSTNTWLHGSRRTTISKIVSLAHGGFREPLRSFAAISFRSLHCFSWSRR
jgi:hypothetical protein